METPTDHLNPDEEKEIIKALSKPMSAGDIQYVISTKWMKSWKLYVSYDITFVSKDYPRPVKIDNDHLVEKIDENGIITLKKQLYSGHDYDTISKEEWEKLLEW